MSHCKTALTKQELFDVYNKNISNSSWSSVHMSYMMMQVLWRIHLFHSVIVMMAENTDYTSVPVKNEDVKNNKEVNYDRTKLLNIVFLGIVFMTTGSRWEAEITKNPEMVLGRFEILFRFFYWEYSPIHPPLKTIFLKPSLNNVSSSEHQYLFRRLFSTAPSNPTPQVTLKIFKVMATSPTLCSTHPSLSPTSWLRGW